MGCLIETPALHYYKTVYENLEIQRLHKGIPGKDCIEKVLELVNLLNFKNKKKRSFIRYETKTGNCNGFTW